MIGHNVVVWARHLSCKSLVWVLVLVVVVVTFIWLCAAVHACLAVHLVLLGDINGRCLCQCQVMYVCVFQGVFDVYVI